MKARTERGDSRQPTGISAPESASAAARAASSWAQRSSAGGRSSPAESSESAESGASDAAEREDADGRDARLLVARGEAVPSPEREAAGLAVILFSFGHGAEPAENQPIGDAIG